MIGDLIEVLLEVLNFSGEKSISNFELIEKLREKNIPTYEFIKYLFTFISRLTLFVGLLYLIYYFFTKK